MLPYNSRDCMNSWHPWIQSHSTTVLLRHSKHSCLLQMLPHTLPQWVEKTPFVMNDGSLWLGSRHTHAFFVDSKTGKLIKAMEEFGEEDLKKHEEVPGVCPEQDVLSNVKSR